MWARTDLWEPRVATPGATRPRRRLAGSRFGAEAVVTDLRQLHRPAGHACPENGSKFARFRKRMGSWFRFPGIGRQRSS